MSTAIEMRKLNADDVLPYTPTQGNDKTDKSPLLDSPVPLPDSLSPVNTFDMELLPEALRPWINDIAERMQCPPDYLAATAMAALGVVVGRRVAVRPKRFDDWFEIPNMWACIVGPPGVMKSPAQAAVVAPLKRLDGLAYDEYQEAKAAHDAEAEIAEMRRDAWRKKAAKTLAQEPHAMVRADDLAVDMPEPPVMRRYLLDDATVESLADVCKGNPQGVGIYRDELVSLLRGLDKEGQEQARGFYLSGWNGNGDAQIDRIGRGHHRLESVCLSIIGSTQPGRIGSYLAGAVKDSASNDGLVQRFGLLVWPDMSKRWENIDRLPGPDHKRRAYTLFERLSVADPVESWGAEPDVGHEGEIDPSTPPALSLDDEALDLFTDWRTRLEHELRSGDLHPSLESHLSKYRKLIPGLALLIHLADDGHGSITGTSMARALAWSVYLRSHAVRAYDSVTKAGAAGAKALLKRIQRGDVQNLFTARDIYRRNWSLLGSKGEVESAITMLVDYGWLNAARVETGGRSSTVYSIHPEVKR